MGMKVTSMFLLCCLLAACDSEPRYVWDIRHVPTTPDEHKELARHIECVLSAQVPNGVSGSDQDWEDVPEVVYREAPKIVCRPTLWERLDGSYNATGRWRYADEVK